ncbi:MAG TPA: TetR/AcrR family transcriptional regulator [Syntrophales bacterium]|nr:TetR/AcrR family transcriptional regulator [Syntrophales bacterium]HOL58917.1 TetR/AcrR family transcriptional regulator [Syntrophales bacterium]HPO35244.1 TetR/AcrR family transcriptional regulator [Syntrophales bacterium]
MVELRRRNQRDVKERQMHIVKKAARLFFKKGYAQTTMRDIARATKINLGNLYNYIESKEDILCRIFYMYHEPFSQWIEKEKILEIEDPLVQMERSVRKVVEMIYTYRKEILLMYRETRVLPPRFMKKVLATEGALVNFFEGILKKGVEKGLFKVTDPFFSANMMVFQMSLYALRSWNLKRYSEEEIKKLMVESVMAPILPPN